MKQMKIEGRVEAHNREVMMSAQYRAGEMKVYPSPLEERMIAFLDSNSIMYESQYIFYIFNDKWISRYYIADFYIPDKRIIVEMDGKFHDKQKQHDKQRTKDIQRQYPGVEVLRYGWKDLSDKDKMKELLLRLA